MSVPVSVSDAADEAVMDAVAVVILPPPMPMSSGNNACAYIFIVHLCCLVVMLMFCVCCALIDRYRGESASEKLIDVPKARASEVSNPKEKQGTMQMMDEEEEWCGVGDAFALIYFQRC